MASSSCVMPSTKLQGSEQRTQTAEAISILKAPAMDSSCTPEAVPDIIHPPDVSVPPRKQETVVWEERLKAAEVRLDVMRMEREQMHARVAAAPQHSNVEQHEPGLPHTGCSSYSVGVQPIAHAQHPGRSAAVPDALDASHAQGSSLAGMQPSVLLQPQGRVDMAGDTPLDMATSQLSLRVAGAVRLQPQGRRKSRQPRVKHAPSRPSLSGHAGSASVGALSGEDEATSRWASHMADARKSVTGALDEAMHVLETEIALATPSHSARTVGHRPQEVEGGSEYGSTARGHSGATGRRKPRADLSQLAQMDPRDLSSQHHSRGSTTRAADAI